MESGNDSPTNIAPAYAGHVALFPSPEIAHCTLSRVTEVRTAAVTGTTETVIGAFATRLKVA